MGGRIEAMACESILTPFRSSRRYKLWIPKENCSIMMALGEVRCPQPSSTNASARAAEPFGDEAKRFAKLHVSQRTVEVKIMSCTNGGVMTGKVRSRTPLR